MAVRLPRQQGRLAGAQSPPPRRRLAYSRCPARRIRCAASSEKAQRERPNRQGESTTDFTPYTLIKYSEDPLHFAKHREEVLVNATPQHCFEIWNKWDNLVDFLDLIGEMYLEPTEKDAAMLLCYYRYGHYPILQIRMLLQKTEIEEGRFIKFGTTTGMPLRGIVEFEPVSEGQTRVELRFEHALPTVLLLAKIGVYGVENHMKTILEQNLATFKMLAEGDLEFSTEKYDKERVQKEMDEFRRAYERSGWLSIEEPYATSDMDDFVRFVDPVEMSPDNAV